MISLDRYRPPVLDDTPAYEGNVPLYEFEYKNEYYNVEVHIDMLSGGRIKDLRFISIVLLDEEWGELELDKRLVPPSFEEAVIDNIYDKLEDWG